MKLLAIFAASALAQDYSMEDYQDGDRRFTNNDNWLAATERPPPGGWNNKSPRIRIAELKCRADQYFEVHWADAPEHTRNNAIKNWQALANKIEEKFEECGGSPLTEEEVEETRHLCGWRHWVDNVDVTTSTNHMISWNAIAVRETILRSEIRGCERRGMRLVSVLRLNLNRRLSENFLLIFHFS